MLRFPRFTVGVHARRAAIVLAATTTLFAATPAFSKVTIGYCQGHGTDVFTVCVLVCCPGDLVPTELCCTTGPIDCSNPGAVMAGIDACMASFVYGGSPVFGPGVPVGTPVAGQSRHEYPLGGGFSAAGCCVIGGRVRFHCGTMSLSINCPCDKPGGPPPGPGPFKLIVLGPPPPGPSTLTVWFVGCPPISVMLDGTETAAMVKDKLLAALVAAGYLAYINSDGEIEVLADCTGGPPLGVEEFGLAGGAPMSLGLGVCPPPPPTPVLKRSWGELKTLYR